MVEIKKWCTSTTEKVNDHHLHILEGDSAKISTAVELTAQSVPSHYISKEHLSRVLRKLGKSKAAKLVEQKLPTSKNIRSGDLGEILGAHYVQEFTDFKTGINRLQWKDHREMAMRGDDIIAVQTDTSPEKIKFLKGEVKSRASLSADTVAEARKSLRKHKGRPSPHALSFLASRLHDKGEDDLADLIDEAQLKAGIKLDQVSHLIFTFSGNAPANLLRDDLGAYSGKIKQHSAGLRVTKHQDFVKAVYEKAVANGSKP